MPPSAPPPHEPTWNGLTSWMKKIGRFEAIGAKTVIVRQGEPATSVFLLVQGMVKFVHVAHCGRTAIMGFEYGGKLMCHVEALTGRPHLTSIETVMPCSLWRVDAAAFHDYVRAEQRSAWITNLLLSDDLMRERLELVGFKELSAQDLLRSTLGHLRRNLRPEPGCGVLLPLRDWEVAQMIAVAPQYLCRLMQALAARGCVQRCSEGWILLPALDDEPPPRTRGARPPAPPPPPPPAA